MKPGKPFRNANDLETVRSESPNIQKAMIEACESGNAPRLQ